MNVLVTGHRGYIGVHLVDLLKQAGHHVTGCDLNLFDGCEWTEVVPPDQEWLRDIRALRLEDFDGFDCVMHLAAISNDPMGDIDPGLTMAINRDGSARLARLAKKAGVGRFLFSGSCSVYGQSARPDIAEDDPLCPLTAYAKSKVETEDLVRPLAGDHFTVVFLRNATAYGDSPMLRLDLVANNLLGSAVVYDQVRIMSDGTPWRPLIHCRDIARAFVAFMDAPAERVQGHAVNVGANSENYQVREVAEAVKQVVPSATITYTGEAAPDQRSYKVNFDLLGRLLPGFALEFPLPRGIEHLHRRMIDRGFSKADFEGERFIRLKTLRHRLSGLKPGDGCRSGD